MKKLTAFDEQDMKAFEPESKIGLIATVGPNGLPHLTLITTIQAKTPTQLIWGQFTEGMSKQHVKENPHTAFLIMTLDRKLWRGKARYTHAVREGEDYERLNDLPMFRYNSYFGIHTVHYMDLVETGGREALPLGRIVPASLITLAARAGAGTGRREQILTPWAQGLFNRLDSVCFLAYVGEDGFPAIIPLVQCQAADSRRLAFSPLAYGRELRAVPKGARVAVLGLTMQMEDVLVRGPFNGFSRYRGVRLGTMDIEWVYNSMPPKHGQIYPPVPIRPVVNF